MPDSLGKPRESEPSLETSYYCEICHQMFTVKKGTPCPGCGYENAGSEKFHEADPKDYSWQQAYTINPKERPKSPEKE